MIGEITYHRRTDMKRKTLVVLVMLLFGGFLIQAAMAAEIVINIDGGSNLEALKETMFNPFEKATGHKLIYDEGANYAKLRAMVKSGNVEWDIAEAWSQDLVEILSREGVLEPIDYNIVGNGMHGVYRKDLYEEFLHPYGVADGFYTSLIGYNAEKFLEGKGPTGWKDFWDVEKFPGPRALQSGPWNNLEFALVADGVPPEELYPLDVDRAFQVLDRIKPHVKVWWTSGAQPVQLLTDKEVDMTSIWNGRLLWIKKQ
jgi:putative spermidine/putrescine transport system substrate-binding protein